MGISRQEPHNDAFPAFPGALTRTNPIGKVRDAGHPTNKGLAMTPKRLFLYAFASLALRMTAHPLDLRSQSANSSSPPAAPTRPVTDDYFGTKVVDPYRYMENLQDAAVQSWFKAHDDHARSVLASIPGRQQLLGRIEELDQAVSRVGAARLPADFCLVMKQLPSENVFKLYRRRGLAAEDALLLDPEKITLPGRVRLYAKGVTGIKWWRWQ